MSLLADEIDDLDGDLDDSDTAVGEKPGPLTGSDLTLVTVKLNNARTHIANVLSLISNAGAPDSSNLPNTLPLIADECVALAQAAQTEANRPNPNHTIIGNKVKTIDRIITIANGYRDRAGIT